MTKFENLIHNIMFVEFATFLENFREIVEAICLWYFKICVLKRR